MWYEDNTLSSLFFQSPGGRPGIFLVYHKHQMPFDWKDGMGMVWVQTAHLLVVDLARVNFILIDIIIEY